MYQSSALKPHHAQNHLADVRSDTVTRPTPAMMDAINSAELGDDVYGDDPTTNQLEALATEMFEKEDALFLSSGTQSNLTAVLAHCGRGDEYIIGNNFHIYTYEAGGTAVLGSAFPHPIAVDERGALSADAVRAAIKPDDAHLPMTKLVSVENTVSGAAHDAAYMDEIAAVAHEHGLKTHCDGARLMNAAIATGVAPARLTKAYDTVSICLSKGLGSPAGSVLVGEAKAIARARRMRKMLGGGMRQTGLLAAAGIHALTHHVARLAEDHLRAEKLAAMLSKINGITVTSAETNKIFVTLGDDGHLLDDQAIASLGDFMAERGVRITPGRQLRIVLHLDISDDDCATIARAFADFIDHYAG